MIAGSATSAPMAPVVLAILDGWGYSHESAHNAIRSAETPVMDALWHAYPHTLIQASGADVGLPDDQMGNSEVGHLTIGSGRIIRQELVRISQEVSSGSIDHNHALNALAERLRASGRTLHLLGLCSDGGVHSHIDHLGGLLRWAAGADLHKVCIHVITDGRDTATLSAPQFIQRIEEQIEASGVGAITTLCGRYWAMDRDNRWERTEKAYRLYTEPGELMGLGAQAAIEASYAAGITDEFLEPVRLAPGAFADGDGVVCFNFRPDRVRQLMRALVFSDFNHFVRERHPTLDVVTFTQYALDLPVAVAFPPNPSMGCWVRWSPNTACGSCARRRPRNTPTSPTSSTAASKNHSPEKIAIWCPPHGSPPTTWPPPWRPSNSPTTASRPSTRGSMPWW